MTGTTPMAAAADVGVVLVAAGRGQRLGDPRPKAFVPVAEQPLVGYALAVLARVRAVRQIAVVVPPELTDPHHELWLGERLPDQAQLVAGGAERSDSVRAGLAALDPDLPTVLIHDAARAFTPRDVFERVAEAVRAGADGVIPVLPLADTIKVVDADGFVTGTPDRSTLRAAQTPQGFPAHALRSAHETGRDTTDDAGLIEAAGGRIATVLGSPQARKVTEPMDLQWAEDLVERGWLP